MRLAAVAVMLAAAVAACGGSSTTGGGGTVKKGGILRIGTVGEIDSLNPFVAIESQSTNAFVMEYPQLVQYGPPGITIQGDLATSWTSSKNGLVWTFHLRPHTLWSDGKPMTSADVAWTGNTILKYQSGPTATQAAALAGIEKFTAPNPTTVVITYKKPIGNVLAQLEQFFILPEHVWDKYTGGKGADLKTYLPQQHLPTVAGGPYVITQYQEHGTTVFKPNPHFYGPKSNAEAVTLTYYTNPTSMVADLEAGNLDFVDQVPFSAAKTLAGDSSLVVQVGSSDEVTNITFNSNPLKPKNRELLNPKVREALEYATPRQQIVNVVFNGFAKPWANLISEQSVSAGWVDPSVKPLPYDPSKADQILNSLGYTMGSGGIREVPATTGKYAQAAHPMSYQIMVPSTLDFDGNRQFLILQAAYKKIGVNLSELPGGDSSQAYSIETAPNGKYLNFDMATWDWAGYIDPNFMLSVLTKAQWNSWSDTGFDNPQYDAWYTQQSTMVNQTQRRKLVWKMERFIAAQRPYIQLVNEQLVTAHDKQWTGFLPELGAYCKCYYTSPHQD
jgi:peptide/nickel transport system substrate-binding protein